MAKLYVIGDKLTLTGLNLAGVRDTYLADENNIAEVLDKVEAYCEGNVIAITHALFRRVESKIERMSSSTVVIELPDRSGAGEDKTAIMIKNAVGRDIAVAEGG